MRAIGITVLATAALGAAWAQTTPPPPTSEQDIVAELFARGCIYARVRDAAATEEHLRRAAELGHKQAAQAYGVWCFTEHRYSSALQYLAPAAAEGDAIALFCLGYMHYKGWGVPINDEEAYRCFSAAAKQGNPQAATMLAMMMLTGEGTEPNPAAAAALLNSILDPFAEPELPGDTADAPDSADTPDDDADAPSDDDADEPSDDESHPEDDDAEPDDADTGADEAADDSSDTSDADTDEQASDDDEADTDDEAPETDTETEIDSDDPESNSNIAADLLEQSDLQLPSPRRLLGYLQLRGVGLPVHEENAFTLIINAANDGDSNDIIEHTIATLFRRGVGIDPSETQADEWDSRVAEEDRLQITPLLNAYLDAENPEDARLALVALLFPPREDNAEKRALIETIMQLPAYATHEADRTNFREMLDAATYRTEGSQHILYISGDGTFGQRIFIRTDKGELYVLTEDWEEGNFNLLRCDPQSRELVPLFTLKYDELSKLLHE